MSGQYKWLSLFALASLVGYLCATFLYGLAYSIPILNYFRFPYKHFILGLFFLTLSVGVISRYLVSRLLPDKKIVVFGLLLLAIVGNFWVVVLNQSNTSAGK